MLCLIVPAKITGFYVKRANFYVYISIDGTGISSSSTSFSSSEEDSSSRFSTVALILKFLSYTLTREERSKLGSTKS